MRVPGTCQVCARYVRTSHAMLRPGGHLVFLRNSTLAVLCATVEGPPSETLQRSQRGLYKLEWTEPDHEIEFQIGHGDWVRVLRTNGFEIEDLIELYAPEKAVDHDYYPSNAEWAKRWPAEEIWKARKRS